MTVAARFAVLLFGSRIKIIHGAAANPVAILNASVVNPRVVLHQRPRLGHHNHLENHLQIKSYTEHL